MPTDRAPPVALPRAPAVIGIRYQRIVNAVFGVTMAAGCIAFIEPSPYDVLIVAAFGLWLAGGFTVPRLVVPFAALIFVYNLGGFFALIPYWGDAEATPFMIQSVYLALTAILFTVFFAENTLQRAEVCLQGYTAGCVVAAIGAIVGYFDIAGLGSALTLYGRAASFFKDPNVLGSYLVLGAVYLIQGLMLGRVRRVVPTLIGLAVIVSGIFLSFSRGSWGVMVAAAAVTVSLALLTQGEARMRRRIVAMVVVAAALAVVSLAILLSIDSVHAMFTERFALAQDYDSGETGRFGNQLRAIPMLLERLNGFGPLRFRLIFGEDPHSSYIGAFSSYGWLGGAAFILLVGLTVTIAVRQVFAPSPFRRVAQVYAPTLVALLLQAFQIDVDHWRHIYLLLGAVWGIEAARLRWAAQAAPAGATAVPIK